MLYPKIRYMRCSYIRGPLYIYRRGVSDFIVLYESSSQFTPMDKKLEKSIRGKKVFKHDKDFPIVKDRETMQIFSRILEILEILEIFFQNLGDSGKPYC